MEREGETERPELISRMFALVTAKLEDGAALAANGQGHVSDDELREIAAQLRDLLSESATVVDAAAALID